MAYILNAVMSSIGKRNVTYLNRKNEPSKRLTEAAHLRRLLRIIEPTKKKVASDRKVRIAHLMPAFSM